MKSNIVNEVHVEGYLYEYKLEEKYSEKNKTNFISGKVSIATNEDCSNVVDFHCIYVTPVYPKSGKENPNYKLLKAVIDSGTDKTVMGNGVENALKVKIDGRININDFILQDKPDEIINQVRNEVNFINTVTSFNEKNRNSFKTDIVITNTFRKEADPEKNVEEHLVIKGAVINGFSKTIAPVSYVVYNPAAIEYFESLEPSPSTPIFTKVWGSMTNQELVTKIETQNAFGAALVEERTTTRKEYTITGALSEIYEWDTKETLLASELRDMMNQRELHLAEVRKNFEDYQKTKQAGSTAAPVNVAQSSSEFKF